MVGFISLLSISSCPLLILSFRWVSVEKISHALIMSSQPSSSQPQAVPPYLRQTSHSPLIAPAPLTSPDTRPSTWHRLSHRSPHPDGREDEDLSEASLPGSPTRVSRDVNPSWGSLGTLINDNPKSFSATLALVIHSMADGIALGASALHSERSPSMLIFAAILVHKSWSQLTLFLRWIELTLLDPTRLQFQLQ